MCINPVLLPNGSEVACHHCWQCVRRKIDDWTGRCIAESLTSVEVSSVTLTYGRDRVYNSSDHVKMAVLTYSDVQKYIRALRDTRSKRAPQGYPVRYFIVGEYGEFKGRAHWHCLLFWQKLRPARPHLRQFMDKLYWPHGWSFWQPGNTLPAVRYVTKYIAKEVLDESAYYHKGQSRLPPLGHKYFEKLAGEYVEAGLAPQDLFYTFDAARDRHGKLIKYQMQGKTRENFLEAYCRQWQERWSDHMPNSDLVEEYLDEKARKGSQDDAQRVLAAEKVSPMQRRETVPPHVFTGRVAKPKDSDLRAWMDPARLKFSEGLNVWFYEFDGEQRPWYWAKDEFGSYGWRAKIGVRSKNDGGPSYLSMRV